MTPAQPGGAPLSGARTLWQLVEERALATPDTPLLLDDLGRTLSAAQLRDTAASTAAGLAELGVGPGTMVTWQLPTSLETVVLSVALARLGAYQNPLITTLREREVSFITGRVGTELLVVPPVWRGFEHAAMAKTIAASSGAQTLVIDHRAAAAEGRLDLPAGDGATLAPPAEPGIDTDGAIRWVYFTSGTTAAPKGVLHTDQSLMASSRTMLGALQPSAADLYPIAFPVGHIGGASMLIVALASGLRLLLIDTFDAKASPAVAAEHGATILGSATPFLQAFLAAQAQARRVNPDAVLYPGLRSAISGGAGKPAGLHRQLADELGGRGLVSSWGMTECPAATIGAPDDTDEELATTEGRPGPGVELRIVDFDGQPAPPGGEGEVWVRGPQLFAGYLAASDLPATDLPAAGPPAPRGPLRGSLAGLLDADGFFPTGDLGVLGPRGHLRITGRRKDIVIRNAENISASEVEEVVVSHPRISEVAVIGIPDPRTGERCCAVVTTLPGAEPVDLDELIRHCVAAGLARYKIPERLETVSDLPRTGMGKIAKAELRARFGS